MKLLLLFAVAMGAALGSVSSAFAHAEPATAKPGDGAVLTQAPAEVTLVMTQEMFSRDGANDIDLVDSAGKEVTVVAATIDRSDRKRLTVAVPSALEPGTYTVKWKTLSADDGDSAEGTLSFTFNPQGVAKPGKETLKEDVLNPGGETPTARPGSGLTVAEPSDGVTWVLVVAVGVGMFVLGAGGAFLLMQKRE